MAAYLSGIETTDDGYLLYPLHKSQKDNVPLVLESVEQLWLKFHPHCGDQVDFQLLPSVPPRSLEEPRQRFNDMSNKVLPVLEDIYKMQDKQRFLTKAQREEREEKIARAERTNRGKIQSLHREQEAHQNKELKKERSVVADYTEATLRVVKTMNSIRLIYPCLINLLNHDARHDKTLEVRGKAPKNFWMIGEYVYDGGSHKNYQTIQATMSLVVMALLSEEEIDQLMGGDCDWKQLVSCMMTKSVVSSTIKVPNIMETLALDSRLLSLAHQHDDALMHRIHEGRHDELHHKFVQAVRKLKNKLDTVLGGRFRDCRLEVYGSCLSDLSIGRASDVDISIHIPALKRAKDSFEKGFYPPKKYEAEIKRHVYAVQGRLQDFRKDFKDLEAVARARVPVVKGCYRFAENPHSHDGSLCFDICFFNDIAVRNSTLLRDYTQIDPRGKNLMLAVKKWAKDHNICSAADERLSSYAWVILAIFYLQQIGLLPSLQCIEMMEAAGFEPDLIEDPLNCINALNTSYVPWDVLKGSDAWKQPDELKDLPTSVLLHGFFHFLTQHFPLAFYSVSIRTKTSLIPKTTSNRCSLSFFSIEDPFETYDSHCPHDLAGPTSVTGQAQILKLLAQSETYLKAVLLGEIESEPGDLWKRSGNGSKTNRANSDKKTREPNEKGQHRQEKRQPLNPPNHQRQQTAESEGSKAKDDRGRNQNKNGDKELDEQNDGSNNNQQQTKQNGQTRKTTGSKKKTKEDSKKPNQPARQTNGHAANSTNSKEKTKDGEAKPKSQLVKGDDVPTKITTGSKEKMKNKANQFPSKNASQTGGDKTILKAKHGGYTPNEEAK